MVKLWDQKISNLRSELNIHGLYRKMTKLANKEELAEDMQQIDHKHGKIEGEIAQLQGRLAGVGRTNKQMEEKLNVIYDRQKEVAIGKRNINCLSCAAEPERRAVQGNDGQVYLGVSPEKTKETVMMESKARSGGSPDNRIRSHKLLDLRWDNIGLPQMY